MLQFIQSFQLFKNLFLLIILFSFSSANLPNSVELITGYTLNWGFSDDGSSIIMNLQANRHSWLGLGIHCLGCKDVGMVNVDYFIASFDENGKLLMDDSFSDPDSENPILDQELHGYPNIELSSAFQSNGYTSVSFMRKLVTNDTVADHPIQEGLMNVIWAYGDLTSDDPDQLDYHGDQNRGSISINFFTGEVQVDKLTSWHGVLMYASYGVLMTFGIFIARYLKAYYWWFPLHIIVQVVAIILALMGFGVGIKMVEGKHLSSTHSWFGFTTLCLTVLAPFLGWAADVVYDPKRTSVPIWPDLIHRWSGRLTVILGYVTIILGMSLYGLPSSIQIAFGLLQGFFIILYIYLDVYKKINSKEIVEH